MAKLLDRFWTDETGNAALDWLILTAGVVLLSAAVLSAADGAAANAGATDTPPVAAASEAALT